MGISITFCENYYERLLLRYYQNSVVPLPFSTEMRVADKCQTMRLGAIMQRRRMDNNSLWRGASSNMWGGTRKVRYTEKPLIMSYGEGQCFFRYFLGIEKNIGNFPAKTLCIGDNVLSPKLVRSAGRCQGGSVK